MNKLLFPAIAGINFFSVNLLVILTAISNNSTLAANLSLSQAAIMAVFYSLSANARSIILSRQDNLASALFNFRLRFLFPALCLGFFLAWLADVPFLIIVFLLLRKALEWFAELRFSMDERDVRKGGAITYLILNTVLFSIMVIAILNHFQWLPWLMVWALLPALFIARLKITQGWETQLNSLLPHIGSTTVIAISTFLFRMLLVWLVGKAAAGELFAAFAIGGLFVSLYMHALGPAWLTSRWEKCVVGLLAIAMSLIGGGMVIVYAVPEITDVFLLTCGFSLVGGSFMLLAQRLRLQLIQHYKLTTFRQDALSNLLLLLLVPLVYLGFGEFGLSLSFMMAGLLSLVCYSFYFRSR